METKKRTIRKMNLLSAVEQVVELSKGSQLNDEFYKKAARPLKHLADKLELSKEQCVMMALFIDNSTNSNIRISDFSRYLDCSTTRVIRFLTDVDELVCRGLICSNHSKREITYRVPLEVIEAFKVMRNTYPKTIRVSVVMNFSG